MDSTYIKALLEITSGGARTPGTDCDLSLPASEYNTNECALLQQRYTTRQTAIKTTARQVSSQQVGGLHVTFSEVFEQFT